MPRFIVLLLFFSQLAFAADPSYLAAAQDAGRWIQASSIQRDGAVVWPADPNDAKSVNPTLYAGTPGPILFFLEAFRATGDRQYLRQAEGGADALIADVAEEKETGLYEGLAGEGFTLAEVYLVGGKAKYRDAALRCLQLLREKAQTTGNGVKWNDTTDIIAGSAGTGLFLLWADAKLHAPGAKELAIQAGDHLLQAAQHPAADQDKWMMDPQYPRELPNFSHGTAGVAYFLATLYQATHEDRFRQGALAGARYLLSIADVDHDMCLIYHNDTPEGRKLYYLSWCHGPAGTARLFYRLNQITGDKTWLTWMNRAANAVVQSGAPQKVVTPGTWNNISMCCGTAGQAAFFLEMYGATHDAKYLRLARDTTSLLLSKGTRDQGGMRWVQAETRVKPEIEIAQTGLMQGASGVGLWLLHLAEFERGHKSPAITLPDNPFLY